MVRIQKIQTDQSLSNFCQSDLWRVTLVWFCSDINHLPALFLWKPQRDRSMTKAATVDSTQQHTKTRSRSPAVPVAVLSSSSESETRSDLSDSSDSEDLENWMILGQGKREEDQSISLHSNTDAGEGCSWWVSEKDMEVQIHNKDRTSRTARQPKRYFTWKNIHCRNCNKTGHLSKSCPEPKKLNCGQPGHAFGTCSEIAYSEKQCHRCGMKGHFSDAGPEIWRQYHLTTTNGPPVTAGKTR
ncbi:Zinc finger CCHC domain-containing protein 7 [Oryzias melastigma]|uniref:Zinc finger CCHC domain-containing protein 7 n=1 Tax=Oryzias melastigma TaxID=30732 RepID=A0A834BSY7_ORYME|nr:Zinc finger CCHC domain-containing protein 7 [Oryzias melastigma]